MQPTSVPEALTASLATFVSHHAAGCQTASTPGWGASTRPTSSCARTSGTSTTDSARVDRSSTQSNVSVPPFPEKPATSASSVRWQGGDETVETFDLSNGMCTPLHPFKNQREENDFLRTEDICLTAICSNRNRKKQKKKKKQFSLNRFITETVDNSSNSSYHDSDVQ